MCTAIVELELELHYSTFKFHPISACSITSLAYLPYLRDTFIEIRGLITTTHTSHPFSQELGIRWYVI